MAQNNMYSEEIRELRTAAGFVSDVFGEDYDNISDYLVNLAGQETLYGTLKSQTYDDGTPVSITAYQIDPVRYKDMIARSEKGAALDRVNLINATFEGLGYEDFDIRGIANVIEHTYQDPESGEDRTILKYRDIDRKLINDPYVSTVLARHIIASDPKSVPGDLEGQAGYWKENWNTNSGRGQEVEFIDKFRTYREKTDVEDSVMDMLRDQDDDPFAIRAEE